MASYTAYTPVNMGSSSTDGGFNNPSVTISKTKLTFTEKSAQMIWYGSFTIYDSKHISGGTITKMEFKHQGTLEEVLSNVSIKVSSLIYVEDGQAYLENTVFGGADTVTGSLYRDTLYGWKGNDTIRGMSGSDRLVGGLGKDRLYGGSGNDIFDLNKAAESGPYFGTRDVVADFVRGQDKVDLSSIDANTKISGNNAFTKMIGASAQFSAPGQLKFADGILYGNTDLDKTAEFSIQLTGISKLTLSDFVL